MKPCYWPDGLDFVRTELDLGCTFASIDFESKNAPNIARNTANARTAYDSAFRYRWYLLISADVSAELDDAFEALRRQLTDLGESFAPEEMDSEGYRL